MTATERQRARSHDRRASIAEYLRTKDAAKPTANMQFHAKDRPELRGHQTFTWGAKLEEALLGPTDTTLAKPANRELR